jgi:ribosomal protein S18 acetylase RimI-like enzyme
MNVKIEAENTNALPQGFSTRGASLDDVEAAIELFNRWSQSAIQRNEFGVSEPVRNEWQAPGLNPGRDIRLVFAPNGQMAGYVEAWTIASPLVHPWIWGRVHPDYQGLGIGTWLTQWAEDRAMRELEKVPADLRFATRLGSYQGLQEPKQLFENMGYHYIRSSYTMQIEMNEAPPEPVWPEGIRVRTFRPETDLEAVYRADTESFRDHFGFVEQPYEEGLENFRHFQTGYEGFDPSLYFLAMDGEEVAGISLCPPCSISDASLGWVGTLAVRRAWRKRGIGLALLLHSFGEFHRRGKRKVGLGVDAENLTGALRLYKNAGMHVETAFDTYEKELRPGREISVKSLSN